MAGIRTRIGRAAATHRQAAAIVTAARTVMSGYVPRSRSATEECSIRELAERLRVAAGLLAPGWLGAPLDAMPASTPLGEATRPELVRIGTAYPLDDASFPVVVPLGHLAFDGDARDARVAGVLRAVLLRLLATTRPGSMVVRAVDPAGAVFTPFAPLHDAGIMPPPVADRAGLQAVLTEAEHWVRGERADRDRVLLLVIAGWPQATEGAELTRLSSLAARSPAALHIVVAGWPPPPDGDAVAPPPTHLPGPLHPARSTAAAQAAALPNATQVTLRNPYALVSDPPGGSFGTLVPPGQQPSAGLNAYVYLDESPPADLVSRVCGDLAAHTVDEARLTLGELLPEGPLWTQDATAGLGAVVGRRAGNVPITVHLTNATPHWLIVGGPRSGKSTLLLYILYGLCSQYGPDRLGAYLLDFTTGTFADLVPQPHDPSYLPHARAVGIDANRADGVAVLRGLARRAAVGGPPLPRIVCMIDDVGQLLAGDDPVAGEAATQLRELAQHGGGSGIHLVLASPTMPPPAIATHCRVRIALPGGSAALDPANDAAAGLSVGMAVVNTASGLGGPRGATRAHEQLVRFPDPRGDRLSLAGLRHRLWRAGGDGSDSGGSSGDGP